MYVFAYADREGHVKLHALRDDAGVKTSSCQVCGSMDWHYIGQIQLELHT